MDRDSVNGYVSPANYIVEGKLELLNTSGTVVAIDLNDIKGVYFVREFGDSEDLTRKTFTTRPRTEGLWVRLKFKDNETVEGMVKLNRSENDRIWKIVQELWALIEKGCIVLIAFEDEVLPFRNREA